MHVYIEGIVTANGGDAAILEAQISHLRSSLNASKFTIADNLTAVARRRFPTHEVVPRSYDLTIGTPTSHGHNIRKLLALKHTRTQSETYDRIAKPLIANFIRRSRHSTLNALNDADIFYYGGGTTLVENYRLVDKFFGLRLAIALNKPIVLGTQSLGPFIDATNAELVRLVAANARLMILRDNKSLDHLREVGADIHRARVLPDVAFSFARTGDPQFNRRLGSTRNPKVAISVREWRYFKHVRPDIGMRRYLQMIADLTTVLIVNHDAEVHFVSTCQGVPEYWTDDSEVALRIVSLLPPHVAARVRVSRRPQTTDMLGNFYASCDLVVATRMHAAILAMCGGTPVLPIVYEYKTEELARAVSLGDWMIDIESSSSAELLNKCESFLVNLNAIAPPMRNDVVQLAAKAQTTGQLVRSALDEAARPNDQRNGATSLYTHALGNPSSPKVLR